MKQQQSKFLSCSYRKSQKESEVTIINIMFSSQGKPKLANMAKFWLFSMSADAYHVLMLFTVMHIHYLFMKNPVCLKRSWIFNTQ